MLQLGMLIWGIIILVNRKVSMTKNKVVTGAPAITIGILFVAMLPICFLIGVVIGVVLYANGGDAAIQEFQQYAFLLDMGILVLVALTGFLIAMKYGKAPHEIDRPSETIGDPFQQQTPNESSNPYSSPRL